MVGLLADNITAKVFLKSLMDTVLVFCHCETMSSPRRLRDEQRGLCGLMALEG